MEAVGEIPVGGYVLQRRRPCHGVVRAFDLHLDRRPPARWSGVVDAEADGGHPAGPSLHGGQRLGGGAPGVWGSGRLQRVGVPIHVVGLRNGDVHGLQDGGHDVDQADLRLIHPMLHAGREERHRDALDVELGAAVVAEDAVAGVAGEESDHVRGSRPAHGVDQLLTVSLPPGPVGRRHRGAGRVAVVRVANLDVGSDDAGKLLHDGRSLLALRRAPVLQPRLDGR